jgi:hypothetical protein
MRLILRTVVKSSADPSRLALAAGNASAFGSSNYGGQVSLPQVCLPGQQRRGATALHHTSVLARSVRRIVPVAPQNRVRGENNFANRFNTIRAVRPFSQNKSIALFQKS